MTDPKHPGPARDIDLAGWLDGVGFHPADTELKQRGHEAARLLVALLATHLHQILPPGRDKSLVFTHLEDVLVRSNRALALGGGPHPAVPPELLRLLIEDAKRVLADLDSVVPYDARIAQYEAEQRGETGPVEAVDPFVYTRSHAEGPDETIEIALTGALGSEPEVKIVVTAHDEGENVTDIGEAWIDDPDALTGMGDYLIARARDLRALRRQVLPAQER